MMNTCVFTADAPALGLRVSEDGDTVTVRLNDLGGRGRPCAVLFVAVKEEQSKLSVLIRDNYVAVPPGFKAEGLRDAVEHVTLAKALDPPYVASSTRSAWLKKHGAQWPWPFDRPVVLALLLYRQSPDVGAVVIEALDGRSPCTEDQAEYWDKVTEAVNKCLATSSVGDLRGGLIRGPDKVASPGKRAPSPVASSAASADQTKLIFALASCQYQSDFLDRMPDNATVRGPADASLLALGDLLHKTGGPSVLLFVGDQVYVDATAGLFDPASKDDRYRLPYECQGESQGSKHALQAREIEVHMMLDDHEISDNWDHGDPVSPGEGKKAYWKYQRVDAPKEKIWHSDDVVHGDLPFFLADARTEREGRTALNVATRNIMSEKQFKALRDWIVNPDAVHELLPKFVTTGSALFPRSLAVARDPACALHSDAWDGYPKSMHDLLGYVCEHEVKGLVFLSGDAHISNCAKVRLWKRDEKGKIIKCCTLHSVHSSGLYAPYPFANAVPEDFARSESFCFPDPVKGPYTCEVRTMFAPPGDGFALLKVIQKGADWQLDVSFYGATGPKPGQPVQLDILKA
jgi:hypothetical protein